MRHFLASEAAGGVALIAAALLAMVAANLPATASAYRAVLAMPLGPVLAPDHGAMTVRGWIDDGLMVLFFFVVGLEIKRELVAGELASAARRRLPFVAAAAGMAVPALVYLAVVAGDPALRRGWAIPAATDIAFAIGVLALLGRRVPGALRLLLTTVAIVDDMGAVAIIALAYTEAIHALPLLAAAALLAALWVAGRRGVRAPAVYAAGLALLWLAVLRSGIHPTVAGVLAALAVPIGGEGGASPLDRLERGLHPWVAFGVVPLFGFANAGVALGGVGAGVLAEPLVLGITLGLFLGKQAGIFGGIWAADRLGVAHRPAGVSWAQLYGLALVAGIGFTMSLFIGGLAFPGDAARIDAVRIGVLAGSLASALAGAAVLAWAGRRAASPAAG